MQPRRNDHLLPIIVFLISYFVGAEDTIFPDEFLEEKWKSLDKEIRAALENPSPVQVLDYSGLLGASNSNLHLQLGTIPPRIRALYTTSLRSIKDQFSREISFLTGGLM